MVNKKNIRKIVKTGAHKHGIKLAPAQRIKVIKAVTTLVETMDSVSSFPSDYLIGKIIQVSARN